jgi:hypothetical protein
VPLAGLPLLPSSPALPATSVGGELPLSTGSDAWFDRHENVVTTRAQINGTRKRWAKTRLQTSTWGNLISTKLTRHRSRLEEERRGVVEQVPSGAEKGPYFRESLESRCLPPAMLSGFDPNRCERDTVLMRCHACSGCMDACVTCCSVVFATGGRVYDNGILTTAAEPPAADGGAKSSAATNDDVIVGHDAAEMNGNAGGPGNTHAMVDDPRPEPNGLVDASAGRGAAGGAAGSVTRATASNEDDDAGSAVLPTPSPLVCTEPHGRVWSGNGHCYFPLNVKNTWFANRDQCSNLARCS